jgi:DnaJ-domain-containing protein 1
MDFSMSAFTAPQRDLANRFKDDFLRMANQNYFDLLGVDRRAKAADIRKAYFTLAKEYHTDKLVNLPDPVQRLGTEMFNIIQNAYDTLTDSELREKYVAATFYGKANQDEAAIEEVQAVLQADQHFKTGMGLLNAGNLSGAHAAFSRARELYTKEPEYNACYGYTLFKLNYPGNAEKCEEGERLLHDALRANPKLDRANLFLGRIYLTKGNDEQAGKYFVRALKINGLRVREWSGGHVFAIPQGSGLHGPFGLGAYRRVV